MSRAMAQDIVQPRTKTISMYLFKIRDRTFVVRQSLLFSSLRFNLLPQNRGQLLNVEIFQISQ